MFHSYAILEFLEFLVPTLQEHLVYRVCRFLTNLSKTVLHTPGLEEFGRRAAGGGRRAAAGGTRDGPDGAGNLFGASAAVRAGPRRRAVRGAARHRRARPAAGSSSGRRGNLLPPVRAS